MKKRSKKIVGDDVGRHSFSILISLSDGGNVGFWRNRTDFSDFTVELLNAGDIAVFRDDTVHCGGHYQSQGHFARVHCYMDSGYVANHNGAFTNDHCRQKAEEYHETISHYELKLSQASASI